MFGMFSDLGVGRAGRFSFLGGMVLFSLGGVSSRSKNILFGKMLQLQSPFALISF